MEISQEDFEKLKAMVRHDYDDTHEVYCPYLGESVKFSAAGFEHLLFKGSSKVKERSRPEQAIRLKLFRLAPELLRITKTLQEFHRENQFVIVKMNKRKEKVMKAIQYWGFVAILHERKIKVIVKQVGEGNKYFWSVIPNWRSRKSYESYSVIQYSGDLEND